MHDKILLGIIESAIYKAAQGVTYWLGYKSSFFENHHVNEGAIVSEFASILQSQLTPSLIVYLEARYGEDSRAPIQRADLAVYLETPNKIKNNLAIIEIKTTIKGRSDSGWKADIAKLRAVTVTPLKILILFTQGRAPKGLLAKDGVANRQSKVASELGFKITRVLRAAKTKSVTSKSTFNAIVLRSR